MSKPYVFVSGRLYPEAEKLLAEHCEYKVWKKERSRHLGKN